MKVTLYSKSACQYCEKAKAHLEREGIAYELVDLSNDDARYDFYNQQNLIREQRIMPQIFLGDEHIGSYDNMMRDDRFRDQRLITVQLTARQLRYILFRMGEPDTGFNDIRPKAGDFSGTEALEFRTRLRIILDGRSS